MGEPGPMRRSFVEVAKFLLNSIKDFGAPERKSCIQSVKELVKIRAPAKGSPKESKVMFTAIYKNIDRYELTRLSDKDFIEKFSPDTWHADNNNNKTYLREYAALLGVEVPVRRRPIYFDEDHTIEQMVNAAQARIVLAKSAKSRGSKKP